MVSLSTVASAAWFHAPQFFYFATPQFNSSAIVTMMLVALTTMIESTGVYFALSDATDTKITSKDMARGYRAEGIAAMLGGCLTPSRTRLSRKTSGCSRCPGSKPRSRFTTPPSF